MKDKKSTVLHWEKYWQHGNIEYINKIVEELQKTCSIKYKKILEIGAGSGATSIKLSQVGAIAICLDYSPNSIKVIKRNASFYNTNVLCVLADANFLPFKSETIDICFHQGFLEHFKDPSNLLLEQYRILKQNGFLLVDVPQKYSFYSLKKRIFIAINKWFAGWETDFSFNGLRRLICGFGFVFLRGYGRFHIRNIDRIQKRLLGKIILPKWFEIFYYKIIQILENSFLGKYTAFSIGVIVKKNDQSNLLKLG
jgi:ubiquinone/menaquinone biosynthesis C-methylase UbiE